MKKVIVLISIVLGVVFLSGCSRQQASKSENIQTEQKSVVYANNEFGFKLQLPDNWKNYTTKIEKTSAYTMYDGKSIPCPNCTMIYFYLPYNKNWKLHQDIPSTNEIEVMVLDINDISTWNTKCNSYCNDSDNGPYCTDCYDYLFKSDKFIFNTWYTVEFAEDINPETVGKSANEFFKNNFTLTEK